MQTNANPSQRMWQRYADSISLSAFHLSFCGCCLQNHLSVDCSHSPNGEWKAKELPALWAHPLTPPPSLFVLDEVLFTLRLNYSYRLLSLLTSPLLSLCSSSIFPPLQLTLALKASNVCAFCCWNGLLVPPCTQSFTWVRFGRVPRPLKSLQAMQS